MSEPPQPGSGAATGAARSRPVFVADEQDALSVDAERWVRLAADVLADLGVVPDAELNLLYVDEEHMATLNRTHLGGDGPTDVLSFPIDGADALLDRPAGTVVAPGRLEGDPDDAPPLLGDIVICPAVAARNAPGHAGSTDAELALLLVHGILHLLGHDHGEAEEQARMWAAERQLLARHWGPVPGDPWAG